MSSHQLLYMLGLLLSFLHPSYVLMQLFLLHQSYCYSLLLYSDVTCFLLLHKLLPYLLSILHYKHDLRLLPLLSLLHYILYMYMSSHQLLYMLGLLLSFLHPSYVLMQLFLLHQSYCYSLLLYSDVTCFLLLHRLLLYLLSILRCSCVQALLLLLSL